MTDPAQGSWKAEARGGGGVVSANLHLINRYTVELQDMGAVPVDHPETLIVAAVLDRGELVSPDATVEARVTGPSGDSIVHELNDGGVEGDSIPLDRILLAHASAPSGGRQIRRGVASVLA